MSDLQNDYSAEQEPEGSRDPLGILQDIVGENYYVKGYLGGGGFGHIYLAEDTRPFGPKVVLKFLKDPENQERSRREAEILSRLAHPNISKILGYLDDCNALVMLYIEGKTCGDMLRETEKERFPEPLLHRVATGLLNALDYVHQKEIYHRDINPNNILIDANKNVYLIDFGIAKSLLDDRTSTSDRAFTPNFAAPERRSGIRKYDYARADIYELGGTLFKLATGGIPYVNPEKPNAKEWGGTRASLLTPEFQRFLKKASSPHPDDRYESVAAMESDFAKIKRLYSRRKRISFKSIVTAAIILGGLAGVFLILKEERSPEKGPVVSSPVETDSTNFVKRDSILPVIIPPQPKQIEKKEEVVQTSNRVKDAVAEAKPDKVSFPVDNSKQSPEILVVMKPRTTQTHIFIVPSDNTILSVDDTIRPIGSAFETRQGIHHIKVINPNWPILIDTFVSDQPEITLRKDLKQEFIDTPVIPIQFVLVPPGANSTASLRINGRIQFFTEFPTETISLHSGRYDIRVDLNSDLGQTGHLMVPDSCAMFQIKGNERISGFAGAEGIADLGSLTSNNLVILKIYWSLQKQ
ncbi:MAG: serine/threonine-protein kinase [candidate division Zixibacteria bacterium]|nr:serine/threonine-protein kinase [candidate division Zixibacteria bacterium]